MKRVRLLVRTVVIVLLVSSASSAISSEATVSNEKMDAFLKMDFWEFDQTPQGWRSLHNSDGSEDHIATAKVLDTYYEKKTGLPEKQKTLIAFHAGQNYGFANQAETAIARFQKSYEDAQPDWNAYVDATIAFLKNDKNSLLDARKKLEKIPGQMNLNVVDRLIKNFGRSYHDAYCDVEKNNSEALGK